MLSLTTACFAQDDGADNDSTTTVRQKLVEYLEAKLSLTKQESEKFVPIYMEYFKELRKTIRENKDDRLVLQQKLADLRLRYRDRFKPILGEARSNDVFNHEKEFIRRAREYQMKKNGAPRNP